MTLPQRPRRGGRLRILDKERRRRRPRHARHAASTSASASSAAIHQAYGAVLVTGPTGSGKSTTLYAALDEINTPEKNIITIEDPVEYQVGGITQVQINPKAGLTFAAGLRAMMRADPDVIMVGEIRDRETAQIAIEAALTGHLVLSTLHTNDAPTALDPPRSRWASSRSSSPRALDCVVAQRLARDALPRTARRATILPGAVLRDHGFNAGYDLEAYEPVGLRALRRQRLQGPHRPLRGDDRSPRRSARS